MKKFMRTGSVLALGVAVALVATGCATAKSSGKAQVCPKCKVVSITRTVAVLPEGEGNLPIEDREVTEWEHSCPGCQGALTTLFKEGKLRHRCSICDQSGYYCPFAHR